MPNGLLAIVRPVSNAMQFCELTHLDRTPIDVARARRQHADYVSVLQRLGCTVHELPAAHDLPDSVFVEDTAVVLDEVAVITRPGAASRRTEVEAMAEALARWRRCVRIEAPATLDGGDVLAVDRTLYVGRTPRSNAEGISALAAAVAPHGHRVVPVGVRGCLHLKSAVTQVAPDALLVNADWVDPATWPGLRRIDVDAREPQAANALAVGGRVLTPSSFPRTHERLAAAGLEVITVDASEVQKAEGGVTCCSVILRAVQAGFQQ
ncbi:MAG: arginine deiminase-related protein [Steroidobacteraceae bacterium]